VGLVTACVMKGVVNPTRNEGRGKGPKRCDVLTLMKNGIRREWTTLSPKY
jgi:hypothetical protein